MKRILIFSGLFVCAFVVQAQYTQEWNLANESVTIQSGGSYRVWQANSYMYTSNTITINTSDSVTLIIDNINIDNVSAGSPLLITGGARVGLIFRGINTLKAVLGAAIDLRESRIPPNVLLSSVNITALPSSSTSDTLKAYGGYSSAGIGTTQINKAKSITISGGVVVAQGGSEGAGIGTGLASFDNENHIGSINIHGGVVIATGGSYGAGIGTGFSYGDMGQMANYSENKVDSIIITGGQIYANASVDGAAIGTGSVSSSGGVAMARIQKINISGGLIQAVGDNHSAAIGTGYANHRAGEASITNIVEYVNISGGNVYAQGARYSAGVGSGYSNNAAHSRNSCKNINISGGVVTAVSSVPHAVDIGGGLNSGTERIIISGGNIKATHILGDLVEDPTNAAGKRVYKARLEYGIDNSGSSPNLTNTTNVVELTVDNINYNIANGVRYGNHIDDSTIYIYMQHASIADSVHVVRWVTEDAFGNRLQSTKRAYWNSYYSIFQFAGQTITPTNRTEIIDFGMTPGSYMDYNNMRIVVGFDVRVGGNSSNFHIVSAEPNQVVIKIDDIAILCKTIMTSDFPHRDNEYGNIDLFDNPSLIPTVNIMNFNAGIHNFVVEYGGSDLYMPCSYSTLLTINKILASRGQDTLSKTAQFGQILADVPLDAGWTWINPDSSVGNAGMHYDSALFCLDERNYYPIICPVKIKVNKATANCDDAPQNITGLNGQALNTIELPPNWLWRYPNRIMNEMGEQEFDLIADTSNFLDKVCGITILVQPSTSAPMFEMPLKKLKVYPNPVFSGKNVNVFIPDDEEIKAIDVYSISGSFIRRYPVNASSYDSDSSISIPLTIPSGIHIIKAGHASALIVVL
jgi:hypothetical protein